MFAMEDSPMSAPDPKVNPKGEEKQKVDSKPMVESKAGGGSKRKLPKLWILVAACVLVVGLGCAAFFAYPLFKKSAHAADRKEQTVVKAVLPLDPFLVNLADEGETRFVKATFQLGLEEEWKAESKESAAIAAMRDSIISLLSSKTAEQIMTAQGKGNLREEIRSRVNAISPEIKVLEVYIVDFVVQL
jgi:flagellar FliL protein